MSRWTLALLLVSAAPLHANAPQTPPSQPPSKTQPGELQKQRPKPPTTGKEEVPPEEDKALSTESFSFNPLEAEKCVRIGNWYLKRGKYRAAEARFRDSTKWNEGYGEAWLRLGEVEEKLKDAQAAKEAYSKYLEVAPDAKNADQVRKKVAKLK